MRFELDSEVNVLYIYLLDGEIPEGGVSRTIEVEEGINVDIDSEGRVLGMEFVDADEFSSFLKRRGGKLIVPEREEDIKQLVA